MRVRVFFVGEAASIFGRRFVDVEFDEEEVELRRLVEKLREFESYRRLEERLNLVWFLVGDLQAALTTRLRDGDVVTVMPPLYEGG
ncbi:hypothetical protein [Thermogladius sp.]|uniref:hypothetical protein n=1 Tax=Thermogladius sp. TaxID=2023064 RepID=UPI003D0EA088